MSGARNSTARNPTNVRVKIEVQPERWKDVEGLIDTWVKELRARLEERGYYLLWVAGTSEGGVVVDLPSDSSRAEKFIEDMNLRYERGAAGRRIRDLLTANNEEVAKRRDLDKRLDQAHILVEALLDLVQKERAK